MTDTLLNWVVPSVFLVVLLINATTQETPQEVEIIKQINRVNEDGSYTFGYEAADGSFKIETRDVLGNVKGMFGFVDESGELKRVSYTANNGTGLQTNERSLDFTTSAPESEDTTRRPVLVLRQPADPTRAPVIQHIPRRLQVARVTSASSTTPVYGDYLRSRRPHIALPTRSSSEEVTSTTPKVTEEQGSDVPTHIPLSKILITKRPLGKGGNSLRRQLGNDLDSTSPDVSDVYTGGAAIPRYVPAQSVRSIQSPLSANLPPHIAAALRQQQLARAAATARPFAPAIDSYPVPIPSPRPAVIDDQEFTSPSSTEYPPGRAFYRPAGDGGPVQVPFPMTSLRTLRDELMEYILQYLQFRLGGGNPYSGNPYSSPFQNSFINPNFPFQNPVNFGSANPNLYNSYFYPNPNFIRNPYQPPFNPGPVGYPGPGGYPGLGGYQGPFGYPPSNYQPQNFPQPLPFSSPNKQQAAQQYGLNQRSAPNQFTPSSVQNYESQRLYERQRDYESNQRSEQAESRGTSDSSTYSLPPADVLRMILARNVAASQSSSTTSAPITSTPVRSVQIIGAASSASSTTTRPPPRHVRHNLPSTGDITVETVDEMEMQA